MDPMSETLKRILSAAVIVSIAVFALNIGETYYWIVPFILIVVASLLGLIEFYTLADRNVDGRPVKIVGIFFTLLLAVLFYSRLLADQQFFVIADMPASLQMLASIGKEGMFLFFFCFLFVFSVYTHHLIFRPIDGSIYSISVTLSGLMYTVLPFFHLLLLFGFRNGQYYIIYLIAVTSLTDAGAYFAGKFMGRHNANLRVSPKKTYEGYVGGIISAVSGSIALVYLWNHFTGNTIFTYKEAAVLSVFVSVISVAGDLVESTLKRDAKKKDSASFIPGHGGMLDLADAMFFTIPAGYYYLFVKNFMGFSI